jgi:hypothetical protein
VILTNKIIIILILWTHIIDSCNEEEREDEAINPVPPHAMPNESIVGKDFYNFHVE